MQSIAYLLTFICREASFYLVEDTLSKGELKMAEQRGSSKTVSKSSSVNVNRAIANANGRTKRIQEAENKAKKEKTAMTIRTALAWVYIVLLNIGFGIAMLICLKKHKEGKAGGYNEYAELMLRRYNIYAIAGFVLYIVYMAVRAIIL